MLHKLNVEMTKQGNLLWNRAHVSRYLMQILCLIYKVLSATQFSFLTDCLTAIIFTVGLLKAHTVFRLLTFCVDRSGLFVLWLGNPDGGNQKRKDQTGGSLRRESRQGSWGRQKS